MLFVDDLIQYERFIDFQGMFWYIENHSEGNFRGSLH
jgi:hypothetical protein